MLELTLTSSYLIADSEVQLSDPVTKGKGWGGEGFSYSLDTVVSIC
jgi:hypothetical protein